MMSCRDEGASGSNGLDARKRLPEALTAFGMERCRVCSSTASIDSPVTSSTRIGSWRRFNGLESCPVAHFHPVKRVETLPSSKGSDERHTTSRRRIPTTESPR